MKLGSNGGQLDKSNSRNEVGNNLIALLLIILMVIEIFTLKLLLLIYSTI